MYDDVMMMDDCDFQLKVLIIGKFVSIVEIGMKGEYFTRTLVGVYNSLIDYQGEEGDSPTL